MVDFDNDNLRAKNDFFFKRLIVTFYTDLIIVNNFN